MTLTNLSASDEQFQRMCEENRILYQRFIWLMVQAIREIDEREKAIISNTVAQESESGIKFSTDI